MSTEREATRIVLSWLRVDEHVSADRILDNVLTAVDATPQRRPSWLARRTPTMNKIVGFGLAAAAVAIAAFIGIQLMGGTNPGGPPSPSESPSATSAPSTIPSPEAERGDIGPVGTTVAVESFTEPFSFTVPAYPTSDPPTPVVLESMIADAELSSTTWGKVTFHDDQPLPANLCLPTGGRIDDVPATPEAVGDWLQSSTGLEVSPADSLTVDGREALGWDVTLPEGVCDEQSEAQAQNVPPPWFAAGENHRVYGVPTGTDTILVLTWGVSYGGLSEEYGDAVNAATDDLVRSMTFGD